jgi:hypothetical protein
MARKEEEEGREAYLAKGRQKGSFNKTGMGRGSYLKAT